ncbi:unnamed protein product [Rhizophagus irregularis]|nr:unnamed protein product [Rhizophagus irregularis]CAB5345095.1 unnamed protein product [Rhizophagus irregularis]
MSVEVLELLRQWPTQDEIHGMIRIAYANTEKFARLMALSKSRTDLCPFIYVDNSHSEIEVEHVKENPATNFNINNNLISENDQLADIAKEMARVAYINQHEKLQLTENADIDSDDDELLNNKLDDLDENLASGSSNQRDNSNECNDVDKINSNEITYLLNHQRSARLPSRVAEPEELLFDDNGELDILKALDIRSQNKIERNTANELVRSLQENDSYVENRPRFNHWEMRKHTESISIPRTIPIQNLGSAGVSEKCLLEDYGLIIVYISKRLYIGRILAKYQKISDRHSYVRSGVDSVDSLSFISIILYHYLSGSYFTYQSPVIDGSNLFIHLSAKNVVYYLGNVLPFNFTNYEMLKLNSNEYRIFSFFQQEVVMNTLKIIHQH